MKEEYWNTFISMGTGIVWFICFGIPASAFMAYMILYFMDLFVTQGYFFR